MTEIQEIFYKDTVDVFRKQRLGNGDYGWLPTPVVSGLICNFQSTENVDRVGSAIGTFKQDNLLTLDVVYFDPNADVNGEDIIRLTTVGHPETGTYFAIMGDLNIRPDNGLGLGYAKAFINKIEVPPWHVSES